MFRTALHRPTISSTWEPEISGNVRDLMYDRTHFPCFRMIKYFQEALEKGLREEVAGGKESDKPLQPNSPANVTQQNMYNGIDSQSLIISY